ncbi:MAG: DUF4573 domain-containing protein [Bacteroidia bacterium]|nr:DUF4573 domain-containing protein [Bacteroidia bacterium]
MAKKVKEVKKVKTTKEVKAVKKGKEVKAVKKGKEVKAVKKEKAAKKVKPAKAVKEIKAVKKGKEVKPAKAVKEIKAVKKGKEVKAAKAVKEVKEVKKGKEVKAAKAVKEVKAVKKGKEVKEVKEVKPVKEVKEVKEIKEIKGTKEAKEVRDFKVIIDPTDASIEGKLKSLFQLQTVDTEIDKIKTLRGELPLEVRDLEDEIAGLETRLKNLEDEIKNMNTSVSGKKTEIKAAEDLIKKYKTQQNNVRNNREYDSLSKEIEFQTLEIELCEKRIKEFTAQIAEKSVVVQVSKTALDDRMNDLKIKKRELDEIISENQKEEEALLSKIAELEKYIEQRLLIAYKRIRKNARNGLAVVTIERDACGGCFNKIPPQRQMDIRQRKKVIVCEYCGRILVDPNIANK